MTSSRTASSQAGWALITGGVTVARVEAHRVHQLLNKALKLVESSDNREHLYQIAGDLIVNLPRRVQNLESQLDELGYALSLMGQDHLKDRLPLSRRNVVEETVESAAAFGGPMRRQTMRRMAQIVAERHRRGG